MLGDGSPELYSVKLAGVITRPLVRRGVRNTASSMYMEQRHRTTARILDAQVVCPSDVVDVVMSLVLPKTDLILRLYRVI